MPDDDVRNGGGRERRRRRLRRAGSVTAAFAGLALAATACGGGSASPGVANVGAATPTGSGQPSSTATADPIAYSQCMRSHGVPDFPDPVSDGNGGYHMAISAGPGSDLDPGNPTFKAAQQACQSLQPAHTLNPSQQAQAKAQGLKYAQCMRSHGVADFPDPQSDGGIAISAKPGGDLDPNNPTFKAADKACQQDRGGAGAGGGLTVNNGGANGGGS